MGVFQSKIGRDKLADNIQPAPPNTALAAFRGEFAELATAGARGTGAASNPCIRAEQLAGALQRLEWAIERWPRTFMQTAGPTRK